MAEHAELTVSGLNLMIADAIRKDPRLRSVTVRGEVSGFRNHLASGHWYFSLKDEEASVNCVMYRFNTLKAQLRPRDGDSVVADGYVDIYTKQGSCQFYVTGMRSAGAGDLYLQFEALKRKLDAEGLFDPARKKPLPLVPRKVAVVTSSSGAALHDVLNVSRMRYPSVPIVLVPTAVQGEGAGKEIAAAVRAANEKTDADVIIVARGGGSAEDLWCFNDEAVARAVSASRIPVVSGVGHEIDTTICDLAADVRASTPSNAAEIVFPDRKELYARTGMLRTALKKAQTEQLQSAEIRLRSTAQRLGALNPASRIAALEAREALLKQRAGESIRKRCADCENSLKAGLSALNHAMTLRFQDAGHRLTTAGEKLQAISPLGVLGRGYALVYSGEKKLLTTAAEAAGHSDMTLRFADGEVQVTGKENA